MESMPEKDLTIVGDFLKYFVRFFIPFFLFGGIFGFFQANFFLYGILHPFIYSTGLSLIVIVINNDINAIMTLIGLGKEHKLSLDVKYAKPIQQIGYLMGSSRFDAALKEVNVLLKEEPRFINALILKGQILLEGFKKYEEAKGCFSRVLALTEPNEEQYKLANSLIAECYGPDD